MDSNCAILSSNRRAVSLSFSVLAMVARWLAWARNGSSCHVVLGLATILDNAISSSTTDAFFARKSGSFATGMPVMLVSACPSFMLVTAVSVGVPTEPGALQ